MKEDCGCLLVLLVKQKKSEDTKADLKCCMHVKADFFSPFCVRKFWEEQFIIAHAGNKTASAAAVALHNSGTENNTSCHHHIQNMILRKKSGH